MGNKQWPEVPPKKTCPRDLVIWKGYYYKSEPKPSPFCLPDGPNACPNFETCWPAREPAGEGKNS